MNVMGFKNETEMIENGICPMCGVRVGTIPFRDEISRKEYKISGLCQTCQDAVFKEFEEI
ncbi:hypothetical protein RSJ42_08645 [Methanosarcina hadiensis]|uniref:hypothetical protein n=1 Tax=Methanosarcina hadiensis TaxID=3078083 RepID=UPI00397782E9